MQLTRPPLCSPTPNSMLPQPTASMRQTRACSAARLLRHTTFSSTTQVSGGQRRVSAEQRCASGGWASSSASRCSSRQTTAGKRETRCSATEEELSQLTYSDEVLVPGDVEIDEDSDDDDEPIDWWAFWRDVDEGEVGDDDMEDERDMEVTAQQKIDKMLKQLPTLREREDYISVLPVPTVKEHVLDSPVAERAPQNPPWSAWDYRAYIEKEGRKARAKASWHARMDTIGRYQHLNVTRFNDLRLIDRHNVPKEWSEEEIWDFITMNGTAADPRDVIIKVEDPLGRCDILEQGGKYIESTEDHLRRTGHWLETEPIEEEEDASVNQLSEDFADFEEPGSNQQVMGVDEGGAASPNALEDDNAGGLEQGDDMQQESSAYQEEDFDMDRQEN